MRQRHGAQHQTVHSTSPKSSVVDALLPTSTRLDSRSPRCGVQGWRCLADIAHARRQLDIVESSTRAHSLVSDDRTRRDVARVQLRGTPHAFVIELDAAHNIATVTHESDVGVWAAAARKQHAAVWRQTASASATRCPHANANAALALTRAAWPSLLGGAMLDALPPVASASAVALATLVAPWGSKVDRVWNPLESTTATGNASAATATAARVRRARRAAAAVTAVLTSPDDGDAEKRHLIPWLLTRAPKNGLEARAVTAAMAGASINTWSTPAMTAAAARHAHTVLVGFKVVRGGGGVSWMSMPRAAVFALRRTKALGWRWR